MKKMVLKVIVFISMAVAFLGATACFSTEDGGMGSPRELADQINSLNIGSANPDWGAVEAMEREYYLSHGTGIEYDDGTIVTSVDQYNTKTSGQSSTPQTPKKDSQTTQKTETAETDTTETSEAAEEPEHEHNYRKEITKMPTCTEPGEATYTCECGDSYTEEIPAKGHDEGEWVTEVEPTCTTVGKEVRKCTTCGEVLEEREIPALGHKPGEWEITKQADWIHDGEQIKKCTVCGEILETQVIPANHTPLFGIGGGILLILIVVVVVVMKRGKSKDKPKDKTKDKTKDTAKDKK